MKNKDLFLLKSVIMPVLTTALIILVLIKATDNLSRHSFREELSSAQNAVMKSAVQCYALEGRYPPTVEYLKENYGLFVNEDKFIIHYRAFASNIIPDIEVLPRDLTLLEDTAEEGL